MRRANLNISVLLWLLALSLASFGLSGCSSGSDKAPPGGGNPNPGGTPVVPPPPVPKIESLAESLETFSFKFDQDSRRVQVSFSRLVPENRDSAGMPQPEYPPIFE